MTAQVNDDILYIIFSICLDYPKEPELVEHPILVLALLRCESYGYPTEKERKKERGVLRQVCRRWRSILDPNVDVTPHYSPDADVDLSQLLRDQPNPVTLRISLEVLSVYTVDRLSAEAPSLRHLMIAPLAEEYRAVDFVMKMNKLTTLTIDFDINGIPFEKWELPSLRTFGYEYDDVEPEDLRGLLSNLGKTITTLSCDTIHYSFGFNEPDGDPDDIWLWCPLLTNLRTSAVSFGLLHPPPVGRAPIVIYLVEFDLALTAPPYYYEFSTPFQRGQTVSFGTTWSTFFSSIELVNPHVFLDFIQMLLMKGYRVCDREGVPYDFLDMGKRFERAIEVYRRNANMYSNVVL